jgi:hypothetical protein
MSQGVLCSLAWSPELFIFFFLPSYTLRLHSQKQASRSKLVLHTQQVNGSFQSHCCPPSSAPTASVSTPKAASAHRLLMLVFKSANLHHEKPSRHADGSLDQAYRIS